MDQRKLFVLLIIGFIIAISSIWTIAQWLTEVGLVDLASYLRAEFLTGTAITVLAALLYLLPKRQSATVRHDEWPFD